MTTRLCLRSVRTIFASRMDDIGFAKSVILFEFSGGKGCAHPTWARFRSHIFTKIRKVLLSFLREPSRSPFFPKRRITQTKYLNPSAVSPTHRKVRAAIPTRLILRLPSSCSRALSEVERMRNEATRRGDHPKSLSSPKPSLRVERRLELGAHSQSMMQSTITQHPTNPPHL